MNAGLGDEACQASKLPGGGCGSNGAEVIRHSVKSELIAIKIATFGKPVRKYLSLHPDTDQARFPADLLNLRAGIQTMCARPIIAGLPRSQPNGAKHCFVASPSAAAGAASPCAHGKVDRAGVSAYNAPRCDGAAELTLRQFSAKLTRCQLRQS